MTTGPEIDAANELARAFPNYHKGGEAMRQLHDEMADAFTVTNRPSFGQLKPLRLTYQDGRVVEPGPANWLRMLREFQARGEELPERVEKLWPETGWETIWLRAGGWL